MLWYGIAWQFWTKDLTCWKADLKKRCGVDRGLKTSRTLKFGTKLCGDHTHSCVISHKQAYTTGGSFWPYTKKSALKSWENHQRCFVFKRHPKKLRLLFVAGICKLPYVQPILLKCCDNTFWRYPINATSSLIQYDCWQPIPEKGQKLPARQ